MTQLAGDHVQMLVGGYELTGDSNRISIADTRDQYDVSAFGDAVHHFVNGPRMTTLEHAGYLNPVAARSHPVLNGLAVDGVISVVVGQNTAPSAGDIMFSLPTQQTSYSTNASFDNVIPFAAAFAQRGDLGGWGRALAVDATITDTATGTAQDHDAASTAGGAVFVHLLTAAASDTYAIRIEGSATGAFSGEETTLATFTLDASALGSERVALSGTIPQYVRWAATRTGTAGDTVQFSINLVRF